MTVTKPDDLNRFITDLNKASQNETLDGMWAMSHLEAWRLKTMTVVGAVDYVERCPDCGVRLLNTQMTKWFSSTLYIVICAFCEKEYWMRARGDDGSQA